MNKFQRALNSTTKQAEANHIMSIKLEYKDKWLKTGTSINHPIHIAYERQLAMFSYNKIRRIIKNYYRDITSFKIFREKLIKDNKDKYYMLFNEDIKYDNR